MGLTVVNMEDVFQILNVISILKFTLLTLQLVTQRSQADALKPTVHHCWTKKLLTIKNVKLYWRKAHYKLEVSHSKQVENTVIDNYTITCNRYDSNF